MTGAAPPPGSTAPQPQRRHTDSEDGAQPTVPTADQPPPQLQGQGVYLLWIPLGAGGHVVRLNGKIYEAITARLQRRPRQDIYHAALEVATADGVYVIELAPVPDRNSVARGVVGTGPVASKWLGRSRIFRYELRRWRGGTIPDRDYAVGGPTRVSTRATSAQQVLDLVPEVPMAAWGRDELHTGEMWNSNSVVSWLLVRAGIDMTSAQPPPGGRAPGWAAGILVARRSITRPR